MVVQAERCDGLQMKSDEHRPKVVIVGAGFGGLFAAKALAKTAADVVLIDRHNYHLFQPDRTAEFAHRVHPLAVVDPEEELWT